MTVPAATSECAATSDPAPITAPSRIVHPLATRASSSSTAPCTRHWCATVAPRPITVVTSTVVWITDPSCTLAFARTRIGPSSPRSTAPYQTEAPDSMVTSPITLAVGATHASAAIDGRLPSYSNSIVGPVRSAPRRSAGQPGALPVSLPLPADRAGHRAGRRHRHAAVVEPRRGQRGADDAAAVEAQRQHAVVVLDV